MNLKLLLLTLSVLGSDSLVVAFSPTGVIRSSCRRKLLQTILYAEDQKSGSAKKSDNKAMAFLRKKGKVGGIANIDFKNAMGVDEGPSGKTKGTSPGTTVIKKAKHSYKAATVDGVVDDLSEPFPVTSSGTQWAGFTDAVMGGRSSGSITREVLDGRIANVLRGRVSLENNGGFVQMATDLALDPSVSRTVDMSDFDGVELDVLYVGEQERESFNVQYVPADVSWLLLCVNSEVCLKGEIIG